MKTSKAGKIMEQLAAHRYYSCISYCQIKTFAIFQGTFGIFAVFQSFIGVFQNFSRNLYEVWWNPSLQENTGWETLL
jgi:hypothetical protein